MVKVVGNVVKFKYILIRHRCSEEIHMRNYNLETEKEHFEMYLHDHLFMH